MAHEQAVRKRHPVRNYLFFAILTILCVIAVGVVFDTSAYSGHSEALGGDSATAACQARGKPVALPEISEASGVALSRRTPGLLWTHKDQGKPLLYALDESGAIKGQVSVTGASFQDVEDIASAPCGSESCLYLADIGDNDGRRREISVYRVREPLPGDAATQRADVFPATYPDGPQDAEALIVSKEGRILVVTKGAGGPITVYRFPEPLHAGASVKLEKVGTLAAGKLPKDERVTGGSVSPDGARVALRTKDSVLLYDARDFVRGQFGKPQRFDVSSLQEPQGEGVALGAGGDVILVSEGGGKQRPGTLARATCSLR